MTETPCTMIGGPDDGCLIVIPDDYDSMAAQTKDGRWWAYGRTGDRKFLCVNDYDTRESALEAGRLPKRDRGHA